VNSNKTRGDPTKPTDHILVYSQSGNDTITLATTVSIKGTVYYITVPACLYGGRPPARNIDHSRRQGQLGQ